MCLIIKFLYTEAGWIGKATEHGQMIFFILNHLLTEEALSIISSCMVLAQDMREGASIVQGDVDFHLIFSLWPCRILSSSSLPHTLHSDPTHDFCFLLSSLVLNLWKCHFPPLQLSWSAFLIFSMLMNKIFTSKRKLGVEVWRSTVLKTVLAWFLLCELQASSFVKCSRVRCVK